MRITNSFWLQLHCNDCHSQPFSERCPNLPDTWMIQVATSLTMAYRLHSLFALSCWLPVSLSLLLFQVTCRSWQVLPGPTDLYILNCFLLLVILLYHPSVVGRIRKRSNVMACHVHLTPDRQLSTTSKSTIRRGYPTSSPCTTGSAYLRSSA